MKLAKALIIGASLLYAVIGNAADTGIKTFILGEKKAGNLASVVAETKAKLKKAGFDVVGEYSPYETASILIITNGFLKANAAKSDFGAFGAAQRVTVTKSKDQIQVAYTNPVYMSNVYHLKNDLSATAAQLKQALGHQGEFGPDEGIKAEDLRDYQYKWLMPYFADRIELANFGNYNTALDKVEAALAKKNKVGVAKVYRIDIPGKEETVIGVSMAGPNDMECSGDKYIMGKIDFKELKSTGHLPYEVVVSKGAVYALPAEFRIAISFPDLSMMGSNSFASIMCSPTTIQEALTIGVGGEMVIEEND